MKHPSDARLELPPALAVRWDVVQLGTNNAHRGFAAALGVCWRGPGRPKATTRYNAADPAEFAGRVLEELLERDGVDMADVLEAGGRAFALIARSIVGQDEVNAALGNSESAAAADTSSPS